MAISTITSPRSTSIETTRLTRSLTRASTRSLTLLVAMRGTMARQEAGRQPVISQRCPACRERLGRLRCSVPRGQGPVERLPDFRELGVDPLLIVLQQIALTHGGVDEMFERGHPREQPRRARQQ